MKGVAMITDAQVKKLRRLLSGGMLLATAALKSGMDVKTARRYQIVNKMPSELTPAHNWRTRSDPFADVWPRIEKMLTDAPELRPKTLFEWLQREYPDTFSEGQVRTLQRRIKRWRATDGLPKEVYFSQRHHPGLLCASDFTRMAKLKITIERQLFDHMLYHFVLTYSNWEHVTICFSESFESFSDGLQNALWTIGGTPARHRSDRMSLAVNNGSDTKEFTERYEALMAASVPAPPPKATREDVAWPLACWPRCWARA
jgi:transposase